MIGIKNIFPECDADTLLVELITNRGRANHGKGFTKVLSALQKRSESKDVLIGVIDSDKFPNKGRTIYFEEFSGVIFSGINAAENVELRKHVTKPHYLVFIHPKFEPWIWKQAKLADVNTADFGYGSVLDLEKVSKHYGTRAASQSGQQFKKFVNAIVQANPPGIILLKRWLIDNHFP